MTGCLETINIFQPAQNCTVDHFLKLWIEEEEMSCQCLKNNLTGTETQMLILFDFVLKITRYFRTSRILVFVFQMPLVGSVPRRSSGLLLCSCGHGELVRGWVAAENWVSLCSRLHSSLSVPVICLPAKEKMVLDFNQILRIQDLWVFSRPVKSWGTSLPWGSVNGTRSSEGFPCSLLMFDHKYVWCVCVHRLYVCHHLKRA